MKMATVAVFADKRMAERRWAYGLNVFENYIGEILAYAGIPFQRIDAAAQIAASGADVLIVALEDDTKETAELIWQFAERGGAVISYAGLPKLAAQLGCRPHSPHAVGYARLPVELGDSRPLRGLYISPWEVVPAEAGKLAERAGSVTFDRPDATAVGDALLKFRVGQGSIERWAVNIPLTVVGLQQGLRPVLADGVPAPDGTGKVDEGILKADDGIELDWELDRLATETGQRYFAHPYADLWREACISQLLRIVTDKGMTLPFTGYWPDGAGHVAMISHDSDGNQDVYAESTLDILQQCGIRSTWCMLEPGYSRHIYERIREAGHELALHYNAVQHEGKVWSREEFDRQHRWFKEATGEPGAVSNKNHYTRFEGWGELFEWCEANGILSDQTRGSSKPGNVGFLFGTCHPYFPIAWANERNRTYNVLEIGFFTQDMDLSAWADSSVIVPFLEQAKRVDGVAHFLFHQVHIHQKEAVRQAFVKLADTARKLGFEFWTGRRINDWVRARRKVEIRGVDADGNVEILGDAPEGLVVWIPQPSGQRTAEQGGNVRAGAREAGRQATVAAAAQAEEVAIKFGVPCRKVVL